MQPLQRFGRLAFAALAIQSLAAPLFGADFDSRHARDLAGNPADLYFQLDTASGQHSFQIGERIPLTLAFSSDSIEKYKLNGATYDRSGRLPTEEFVLDREDVTDPYQDYFGAGVLGWLAGGLRGYPVLGPKPHEIELNLNDWFRFDRPGRYRFYLKSHRLTRERAPGEAGKGLVEFAAVSNIVGIEILPGNPGWEAAKLSEIRAILDSPEREAPAPGHQLATRDAIESRMTWEKRVSLALNELRCLETPDAVRLALEEARKTGKSPDTLLLVGARDHGQMIASFDAYLADPHVGISEWDIQLRALFALLEKNAPKPLPMFLWQMPDGSDWQKVRAAAEARQKPFEEIVRNEAVQLIPIIAAKDAEASKISSQAIAAVAPEAARAAGLVPPYDYGLSREELIAQFPHFPPERQAEILDLKWDLVRGPEMIPALRAVIGKAEPKALSDEATSLGLWGVGVDVADSALRRLAQLSLPDAARILRSDIASGKPRFAAFAVRELPAQEMPEADDALSAMLKANSFVAMPLVAKFATARLANQMRALKGLSGPCLSEEPFVAYFVRAVPGEGAGEGGDILRRAMADREKRGCYRSLLNRVAEVVWNNTIEAQAIATLDDPDPEAATSAAQVLAAHGGVEAEPLLWKRLERWSAQWRGRSAELAVHPITEMAPKPESQLGPALSEAIASAQSWVLDEPRRKRLLALCIDDRCREQWGQEPPHGPIPVEVSSGGGMYPAAFSVERYIANTLEGLKTKLLQFPAGSTFRWCPQAASPSDAFSPGQRTEMFNDLSAFLSKRSMRIEPYLEEKCTPGAVAK
ncbi:MAG: hypothetical protein ABSH49_04480 [Bryobacteraceae bacterium]|jgi:hypothetical protein